MSGASARLRQASTTSGRADVRCASTRCPYCRDDVVVEASDWLACRRCLARHHRACWREAGRCAACSAQGALGLRVQASQRRRSWRGAERRPWWLVPLLALVGWVALGGAASLAILEAQDAEAEARARVTRGEVRVAQERAEATKLEAALAAARAELTALRGASASHARSARAWVEGLEQQQAQLARELEVAREREQQRLLQLQQVSADFPALARGLAAMQRGSYLTALGCFDEAVAEREHDGYVYACRGTARHALGELEQALEDLDTALALDPSLVAARYHRGLVRFGLGKLPAAEADLLRVCDALPSGSASAAYREHAGRVLGKIREWRRGPVGRALQAIR